MKTIVPFSKEIALTSKVHEITSISLEHEVHLGNNTLSGDFIVSGDYRTHILSINKEPFSYRLPFEVELGGNIDLSSVNFDISDFNYELEKDEVLKVDIEFSVEAEEKEVIVEEAIEQDSDEDRDEEQEKIIDESEDELEEETIIEEIAHDKIMKDIELFTENAEVEETVEEMLDSNEEERLDPKMENEIIKNVVSGEDEYVTYHVHIVRDGETIESICAIYNADIDLVKNYNDISDILVGDKLLIPDETND